MSEQMIPGIVPQKDGSYMISFELPNGACMTPEILETLADISRQHKCLVHVTTAQKIMLLGMDFDQGWTTSSPAQGIELVEGNPNDPHNRPIAELDLSVRARRIIEMFKIRTIGDLCRKTEAELMSCPNFGQTSLNEIRTKLDELGLSLNS